MTQLTLDELNAAPEPTFVAALGLIFEDAPWVASSVAPLRPFSTISALHEAMTATLHAAPEARQLAFLRGHPELAGQAARQNTLGQDSAAEQRGLGLAEPGGDTAEIAQLNQDYAARFGFPFILCVRRHSRPSVLAEFRRRVTRSADEEWAAAMQEIGYITRLRLSDRISGPGAPAVYGRITSHVLDTARGRPAANIPIALRDAAGALIAETHTNADGRTDQPLYSGAPLRIGPYELTFDVGTLFDSFGGGFFDLVPIRFRVTDPEGHHHVPLVISPGAYSTYRGS